jgi:hypothetical protein
MTTRRYLRLGVITLASIIGCARAALDERRAEPAYAKFHKAMRACLKSTRPECLTQDLDPAFAFHPW